MLRIINRCQSAQTYVSTLLNPRLIASPSYQFAKLKKEKTKLHVPTIHISKLDEEMDGFVLYENRQGGMFKFITLCFIGYFMWGYWTYSQIEDEEIKVNYMIMGALLVIPFLIFQFRVVKTLKSMVLDKAGENVVMTRFQSGGFGRQITKTRVEVLKGIGKAFVFGGSVIKGGGIYGLEERNYWFQARHIREPLIFEEVVQGNRIKVEKTKRSSDI